MKTPYKMRNNRVGGTGCAEKANLTVSFSFFFLKHLPALMNSPSEDSKNEVGKHMDVLRKRSTHG